MSRPRTDLSQHPVGLVPATWLAAVLGMAPNAVAMYASGHKITTALTRVESQSFPRRPSTFSAWVTAWGLDRVLAWLDQYAPTEAAFVRTNADRIHDRERDEAERKAERRAVHLACINRRNARLGTDHVRVEKREAARRKQARRVAARREARIAAGLPAEPEHVYTEIRRRRRDERCSQHPCGLVPDNELHRAAGIDSALLHRYRTDHGIAAFVALPGRRFGAWRGSFAPLLAAWGTDRARAWVTQWMPDRLAAFDRDAADTNRKAAYTAPAPVAASSPSPKKTATGAVSKRGDAARPGIDRSVTVALAKRAERDGIAREAADRRRPPAPENGPVRAAGRVETVEEWLARGGRVTRLVGAGNANVGEVQA